MAIGLGHIFGFSFLENFDMPYISRSITEFWRRWHMSLGSFFRDYVYIPLGGNRRHQLRNIAVVWFLTGLWHGASWNFIFWGLYFGVFLIIEKYVLKQFLEKLPAFFSWLYAFILVLLGWVLFYFTDLNAALSMYASMFGFSGSGAATHESFMILVNNLPLILTCAVASSGIVRAVSRRVYRRMQETREDIRHGRVYTLLGAVYGFTTLFLCTVSLVGSSYNPFLYFRF
jgi:alginate O-acetyltransferase complex protein AlgI